MSSHIIRRPRAGDRPRPSGGRRARDDQDPGEEGSEKGSGSALPARLRPGDAEAVLGAYLASLGSPRSRSTVAESLRRVARLVPAPTPLTRPEEVAAMFLVLPEDRTWDALQAVRSALAERYPPATANLTLSALRGVLRTAYLKGLLSDHQAVLLRELKSVKGSRVPRGVALSPEHEGRLRAEARELPSYQGAMMEAAIALSIGAGLRREEVCRLTIDAVGPGELQVLGKGNKERRPVVDVGMQRVLDRWLRRRALLQVEHRALFVSPERPDVPISQWSYWRLVREVAHLAFGNEKQGRKGRCAATCRCHKILTGPHDFRRTFASRMLDAGFDLREVQQLMGHESVATTQRYDKRSTEALYERRRKTKILADVED